MNEQQQAALCRAQLEKIKDPTDRKLSLFKFDNLTERLMRRLLAIDHLLKEGSVVECKECGELELPERLTDGVCDLCLEQLQMICPTCNGTNESINPGSNCYVCKGSGLAVVNH